MRDLRGDLQDRADLLEQKIRAAQAEFDWVIEQITREQARKISDLAAEIDAIHKFIELADWHRRIRASLSAAAAVATIAAEASATAAVNYRKQVMHDQQLPQAAP
jgi:hypothetical protein